MHAKFAILFLNSTQKISKACWKKNHWKASDVKILSENEFWNTFGSDTTDKNESLYKGNLICIFQI